MAEARAREVAVALALLLPAGAVAQVRTDASLGRPAATLPGPTYAIPQAIGRTAGNNLFHSFQSFSVGYGEAAVFSMAPTIANVIARVTGGETSFIRGTLRVEAGGGRPDFWLLNPAGVMFGGGAQLDVPGAFHVTTANYLRFADGELHADLARPSTFSAMAPEAFGFLGTTRAQVRLEDGAQLRGRGAIDVVAGDFTVSRAELRGGSADVRIVAFGSAAGEVPASGAVSGAGGSVTIAAGGQVRTQASSSRGGDIAVSAGSLALDGAGGDEFTGIRALTESGLPSGSVSLTVNGDAAISRGAQVSTGTGGVGDAGPIHISARNLLIDGGNVADTGVISTSGTGSSGRPGAIEILADGTLTLIDGALIASNTRGSGNAGNLRIAAGDIVLDGRGSDLFTGIYTQGVREAATGSTGTIEVDARNQLTLLGGSEISTRTEGPGDAGGITVHAGTLTIDGRDSPYYQTAIDSTSAELGRGRSGNIVVRVDGKLSLLWGGVINADTNSDGPAGNVNITARDILIDGGNAPLPTGISSDALSMGGSAGAIEVRADTLVLRTGGFIVSDTFTGGRGGSVLVVVRDLLVDGAGYDYDGYTGISSDALENAGPAGNVEVRADTIRLANGGAISSDTWADGAAGSVLVVANAITIEGHRPGGVGSAISSNSQGEPGNVGTAGSVRVEVGGPLTIVDGGLIGTGTFTAGNAGRVSVRAGSLVIDDREADFITGLSSQTETGSTGNAGSVELHVTGDALIHGAVSSATFGTGHAGSVDVRVDGDLAISATSRFLTGIYSNSVLDNSGAAGNVSVAVGGRLDLSDGGSISSDTYSAHDAGTVQVSAGSLSIRGAPARPFTGISTNSWAGASGHAGDVTVDVSAQGLITQGGLIASSTSSPGDAGSVTVRAGTLVIDGTGTQRATGVTSTASAESSGDAGRVRVEASDLQVRNGGVVSTTTFSPAGRAGTVEIVADRVLVDGAFEGTASVVSARSAEGASGQTGDVSIAATQSIVVSHGGEVSIGNDSTAADPASVVPSRIALAAPTILVSSGGSVTAQSTGNVSASNISVAARDLLALDSGSITTSANLGNGGDIAIDAGTVSLANAQVTTSVLGTVGNGGDIRVHAEVLRMETGFIQANTAAPDASGGNVAIDARTLVASGSNVFVGGSTPIAFAPGVFGLNVIQAAAPTGVSGAIDITSPVLDTSGTLAGLGAAPLDTSLLGRSPCRVGAGSSLALAGRGGLAPSARESFRLDPSAFASGAYDPRRIATTGTPCPQVHAAS